MIQYWMVISSEKVSKVIFCLLHEVGFALVSRGQMQSLAYGRRLCIVWHREGSDGILLDMHLSLNGSCRTNDLILHGILYSIEESVSAVCFESIPTSPCKLSYR